MSSTAAHIDEFPFPQVSRWLADGSIVPFIGAGASRGSADAPSNIPDGRALADELASEMPGAVFYGVRDNLAKVAQFFQNSVFDRQALYDFLRRRLEVDQAQAPPSAVAHLLANIPQHHIPFFIITTNYDTLIERAFRQAARPLCVITQNMRDPKAGPQRLSLIYPDGGLGQEDSSEFQWSDDPRYPPGTTFLFKMHGSVHRAALDGPDDVIITEDDYVDFMVNSGGKLSSFFPPASLTAAYKKRRFLFLGYSLYDWNFRAFLRMLTIRNALSGNEARRHYAIQLEPEPIEVELWKQRNVNVYDGDLSRFCERIMSSLEDAQ
jgi:NAD-dependent SIR2 family protein deacetylase